MPGRSRRRPATGGGRFVVPSVADCSRTAGEMRRRVQRPALHGYERLDRVREDGLHLGLIATKGCDQSRDQLARETVLHLAGVARQVR